MLMSRGKENKRMRADIESVDLVSLGKWFQKLTTEKKIESDHRVLQFLKYESERFFDYNYEENVEKN